MDQEPSGDTLNGQWFGDDHQPCWPDCNADLDDMDLPTAAAIILGTLIWFDPLDFWQTLTGAVVRLSASGKGCHGSWPTIGNPVHRIAQRALIGDDPLRIKLDISRVLWENEILWDQKKDRKATRWLKAGWCL